LITEGYDFVQAVADIVDNSIAAHATRIDLTFRYDGNDSWLRIADDGFGMNGRTITEAMRYGADARAYEQNDLGKFGLG
jgi:DNA mismatch repair ATPase MutL